MFCFTFLSNFFFLGSPNKFFPIPFHITSDPGNTVRPFARATVMEKRSNIYFPASLCGVRRHVVFIGLGRQCCEKFWRTGTFVRELKRLLSIPHTLHTFATASIPCLFPLPTGKYRGDDDWSKLIKVLSQSWLQHNCCFIVILVIYLTFTCLLTT